MGTNYHWHEKPSPCDKCGHDDAKILHIGRSSFCWVFMLHIDPEEGLHVLEDWFHLFNVPGSKILSEYGTLTPVHKMKDIILDRENSSDPWSGRKMTENRCFVGPNGLYRGIDNDFPVDDATYDLVSGEFS